MMCQLVLLLPTATCSQLYSLSRSPSSIVFHAYKQSANHTLYAEAGMRISLCVCIALLNWTVRMTCIHRQRYPIQACSGLLQSCVNLFIKQRAPYSLFYIQILLHSHGMSKWWKLQVWFTPITAFYGCTSVRVQFCPSYLFSVNHRKKRWSHTDRELARMPSSLTHYSGLVLSTHQRGCWQFVKHSKQPLEVNA